MPDQELKILITGDASGGVAAAQQQGEALKKLKVDTSDLSEETKRSLGLLAPLGEKAKGLATEVEKSGEKFGESRREIREMGNELGKTLGIAGGGHLALGGLSAAIVGVSASIEFLKKTYEDIQEAIKGPINVEVHDDAAKIEASAKAWNAYAEALKRGREAANTPETQTDNAIKQLETKLGLLKQVLKAEEEEALAALAANKDKLSPQAYDAAVARLKSAFAGKDTAATEDEQRDVISAKEKEAADLAKSAADKKSKADSLAISPDSADARAALEDNVEDAKKALKESREHLELISRVERVRKGEDVPEYEGILGKGTAIAETFDFDKRYGRDATPQDARRIEETRQGQAEQQITAAARAKADTDKREEERTRLANEAAADQLKSEGLTKEVGQLKQDFNARSQANQYTTDIQAAGRAITQGSAAAGNNTPQGYKDEVAAVAQQKAAIAALVGDLATAQGQYHEILQAALINLQRQTAINTRQIQQGNFNGK